MLNKVQKQKKKELNEKKNIHSTKITSLKNKKLELCSLLYYHQKNRNMMMEKNTDIIENEESTENVKDMKYMKNIKDIVHDVVHDENINKIKLMKETVDKKKIKVENCKKKLENISKQEIDIYEKEKVIKECLKDVVSLINKQNDIFEEQKRMNIYFKEMVIVNEDMKKLNHFYLFQSLIDNLLNTVKEKQWDRKLIKEFINFLDMCQKNNPTFLIKQILDFFLFSLEKSLQQTTSTFSSYNNKCSENMQMNSSTQFIKKNVSADFVQKNNDEMLGKKKETMERTAEMTSTGSRLGSGSTLRLRSRSESGLELNNKADSFFSSDDDMDFVKGNKRDHFFFPTNQNDQRKLSTKGKVQLLSSYNLENERKYKEKYVEELLNENNFPHKIDQINMNTLEKERKLEKKYECEKESFDVYRFLSDEKSFFSSEKIDNTILFVGDFSKIYNNLLSILYIEENKKKEEMKTIYYVKDFFNKKKHSVCDKIKDFENSIKMEKNIRESLDSVNADLLQMFERKKRKIENKIVRNEIFIKKCELIQRKLKRRIIKNKYCFFWENKNYYILIHMLKDLILKMTQVNKEVTLEEGALLKMENERSYNEALKNEIEELNKSINKKKEDILCLEEEKVKLEQMKHSIIINQNLKKLHERFLAHHKEVINFLKKIKDNVFSIDINNNNIHNDRDRDMYMDRDRDRDRDKDTIKTLELIITEYENILEQNYDIHSFVEESFNFLNEKTKINICLFETEEKLAKEIEMCCDRMNELKMKEAEYNGQLVLRNEYIDRYKKEINSKYYINIENEYKKKIVETYVYKNVIKDILIFYKAFDEAIIKFHSLKMQEINTSIKNLWRRVYNSSDIDYIYIKSDIQSTTNDKFVIRKSYNYRVVMVKDKCELDMKGRCSSGQKVLSSIIIRLALAESFSIRCGILALDEPTTNLDKKNSKNLASLIANIVELRKETSTFQLILITHDTYFVNMLTQHGLTNCFYQVSRDENGYSTIKQLRS